MKPNSQLNTILIDEVGKKNQLKKERKNESIESTRQTRDLSHDTGTT
jgi:hypothetical protein